MNKQLFPILVKPPPPSVPEFMETHSLILLSFPITNLVFSPENLRSCGSWPIEAKGQILVSFPI